MKIIRYFEEGTEIPSVGVTDGESAWNIEHVGPFEGSSRAAIEWLEKFPNYLCDAEFKKKSGFHLNSESLAAPIEDPGKVFCIGRNYADHASEMGSSVDEYPVVFNKFPSVIIGPNDKVKLPSISDQVDYEAELVVVIGKGGANIDRSGAMDHVFGYTCGNDISARDWQKNGPGGQWLLGKSFDTFAPLGPWIVTKNRFTDPPALDISMSLNGETMQASNTSHLIFDIPYLVSHLSKFCRLAPGDLIFTGTPAGVGAARKPPVFLKPGDQLEVTIENIGTLKNSVIGEENK